MVRCQHERVDGEPSADSRLSPWGPATGLCCFSFFKTYLLVRDSLQIVQSEWNIVKLGNAAHFGMCKRARLKDLYMEANKSGWFSSKTIPLMTNKIIEVRL